MGFEQINIIKFSHILHRYEKDILEGKNKLSLTVPLLHKINYTLDHNRTYFSNSKSTEQETLKCLDDLIRRTPKLIITQRIMRETWNVDLRRFSSLKYLELNRVPLQLVEGVRALRCQIQILVCERCKGGLEEVLGSDVVWKELRTAKLCHNGLVCLPPLTNTPWLEYLDLSHNDIEEKLSLQTLNNLKYLNLSFNSLTSIPMLSEEVCRSLRVFQINNNYVQDLAAISVFDNLEALDVSHNLLTDHSAISPILFLPNLLSIDLRNNPISYHPFHRFHVCSFLNKQVIRDRFLLDGRPLSKVEQKVIGRRGEIYIGRGLSISEDHADLVYRHLSESVRTIKRRKTRGVVIIVGAPNSKLRASVTDQKHLETEKQEGLDELKVTGRNYLFPNNTENFIHLQNPSEIRPLTLPSLSYNLPTSFSPLTPKIPLVRNQFDSVGSSKDDGGGMGDGPPATRLNDSDIEVISDPSQSSIEVFEVQTMFSRTMTSSSKI